MIFRTSTWLLSAVLALSIGSGRGLAATYHVATNGDDGSQANPWLTLQFAADQVAPGDVVIVHPGNYQGFYLETSGLPQSPIRFSAQPGVFITEDNETTPDGINLEGASYVVIEGFTVNGRTRTGIRAVLCQHVTIRANKADGNGRWGILTGFCDDLIIEDNEMSGSLIEHGIYVSNSGDRPIIRRNRIWNNNANGIHMNGDAEQEGDGIISGALVERNVIFGNGVAGGSGINCDGVQDSRIQNNLLYANRGNGISLYRIDGGAPSNNNVVVNNTVIMPNNGRWCLNLADGSSGNTIYNNIFYNSHGFRGAIVADSASSVAGLTSNFNVMMPRFSLDDGDSVLDLAEWQTQTGQDQQSILSTPAALFVNVGANDYHLLANSPAANMGTSTLAPTADLEGNSRPSGSGWDAGAYERFDGPGTPVPTATLTWTATAILTLTMTRTRTATRTATATPSRTRTPTSAVTTSPTGTGTQPPGTASPTGTGTQPPGTASPTGTGTQPPGTASPTGTPAASNVPASGSMAWLLPLAAALVSWPIRRRGLRPRDRSA